MTDDKILLAHGAGGLKTQRLIKEIFLKYLGNIYLNQGLDAACLAEVRSRIAVTTDSYVIKPIIFPGGDIGKLAICGTVNDLAVMGAKPQYITLGLILEEGLSINELEKIIKSLSQTAKDAGVMVVAGDTKVVEKGAGDKMFINTAGIGILHHDHDFSPRRIEPGDKLVISGSVGNHGLAILAAREKLSFSPPLESDCTYLNLLIQKILDNKVQIKLMRDPTRGGLATTLNEIAEQSGLSIKIYEDKIPIDRQIRASSSLLGLDPLYMANEGKVLFVVNSKDADKLVELLKQDVLGRNGAQIGEVTNKSKASVLMETDLGTKRVLRLLDGDPLPRIC